MYHSTLGLRVIKKKKKKNGSIKFRGIAPVSWIPQGIYPVVEHGGGPWTRGRQMSRNVSLNARKYSAEFLNGLKPVVECGVQGYIAHKKRPTPIGPR